MVAQVKARAMLLLWVLLLIGFALRFGYIAKHSLWVDEAFTVSWCSEGLKRMLLRIAKEDRHPPLYCLLTSPLMHLFGISEHRFATPLGEALARFVSALSGVALIVVTVLFALRVGGVAHALLCATLIALHPGAIRFSQEARPYMLHVFLSTLACLLFVECLNSSKRGREIWLWLASALSLLSCYMAILPLLSRLICTVLLYTQQAQHKRSLRALVADLMALVVLLLWLAFAMTQENAMGTKFGVTHLWHGVVVAFILNDFFGYEYGLSHSRTLTLALLLISLASCLIALAYIVCSARSTLKDFDEQRRTAFLLLVVWFILHACVAFACPILIGEFNRWQRVIDGIVPIWLLVTWLSVGVKGDSLFRRLMVANARLAVASAILLHAIGTYNMMHDRNYFRDDWRGAGKLAMAHENEVELIILNAPAGSLTFRLYYAGRRNFTEVPSLVTDAERMRATAWLNEILGKHRRILVIENRLWQIDPTDWLNRELKKSAHVLMSWNGSRISAKLYQVKRK